MQFYVGIVHSETTIHNPNVTGGIDLFWWPWRRYRVMRCILPSAACSGLPLMPLDTPAGQVFATYCPGGCHSHQCCMWVIDVACGPIAYKTQIFAYYHLRRKNNCWFLWWNEKEWLGWYWQRMFNIQCEDLMMLSFSNTKSSMLFKILSVGEAP